MKLRTDKDVDTELWDKSGTKEVAIVAWRHGKINSATAASIKYAGAKVSYSGYNGIASKDGTLNFGHEDIKITGKANVPFVMRAFAFDAGTARVWYSWGADPKKCAALKAKRRNEQKAKHAAKQALKKKLKEKDYKAAVKVLQGSTKGCKGAKAWVTTAKKMLSSATVKRSTNEKSVKKCQKALAQLRANEAKGKKVKLPNKVGPRIQPTKSYRL